MFSSSGSICGELIFIIQVESSRLILCVNLVSVDPRHDLKTTECSLDASAHISNEEIKNWSFILAIYGLHLKYAKQRNMENENKLNPWYILLSAFSLLPASATLF